MEHSDSYQQIQQHNNYNDDDDDDDDDGDDEDQDYVRHNVIDRDKVKKAALSKSPVGALIMGKFSSSNSKNKSLKPYHPITAADTDENDDHDDDHDDQIDDHGGNRDDDDDQQFLGNNVGSETEEEVSTKEDHHPHYPIDSNSKHVNPFDVDQYSGSDSFLGYDSDEDDLNRYSIDGHHHNDHQQQQHHHHHGSGSGSHNSRSSVGGDRHRHDARSSSSSGTTTTTTTSFFTFIKTKREEAKRRHTARALALSGKRGGKLIWFLESSCDLFNQGMIFVAAFILVFVLAYRSLDEHAWKSKVFLSVGILALLFRFFWWPLYWFLWGRRVEERRRVTMQVYDGLNGEAGTSGFKIPEHVESAEITDDGDFSNPHVEFL